MKCRMGASGDGGGRLVALLSALLLMLAIALSVPAKAFAATAGGTVSTCEWELDDDGTLTIGAGTLASNDGQAEDFWPWHGYSDSITKVVMRNTVKAQGSLSRLFSGLSSAVSIDLMGIDSSSVTDMRDMFCDCSSLASLDLSPLDTSSATYMGGMFHDCSSITSLDLSSLDTSLVEDMSAMFYG